MKRFKKVLSYILILVLVFVYVSVKDILGDQGDKGDLEVHFIDVGQGDSTLIKCNGSNILIDGGKRSSKDIVLEYLNNEGIKKLNYVVATHPHEDHIGGLAHVIENIEVEEVIMPEVTTNTKVFEALIDTIGAKGLEITGAKSGNKYELDKGEFLILAPNSEKYSNLNNYSVAIKLEFGNKSFIFTGDAEVLSEKEIIEAHGHILKSDVLKVGHHGSNTSTMDEFLDSVKPDHAVISVGENNTYQHPHKEVLDKLEKRSINVYRTDLQGNILVKSDGKDLEFAKKSLTSSVGKFYDRVLAGVKTIKEKILEKYTYRKLKLQFI